LWSGTYVFSYTGTDWQIDYGPVPARTYATADGGNDFGAGITSLSVSGHSLEASEEFGEAGDCGGCASGKATTTWSWSKSDPGHLLISNPAPSALKVSRAVTPGGFAGGTAMGNQVGPQIAAGAMVPAVCTGESGVDGSLWVELDTGSWIPSSAIAGALPADCDGQPFQQATACPSSDDGAFTSVVTAGSPPGSNNTATVSNSACAGNWAMAAGQLNFGPGGGGSEWWFAVFSNSSGQWSAVEGPDDGTCLVVPTADGCPDGTGQTVLTAPLLTVASLVSVSGLEFNPQTGTVTPPGVSAGSG
jgi:hypothetical protein